MAFTNIHDGCHKYPNGYHKNSKCLPQIFKRAMADVQMAATNIYKQTYNFMLIGLSWVTHIHLKTIILAALKRNVMLNLLKLNKLFAKLVYKELARNGKEWHWKGLMKWIAKEMKYLSVN